MPICSILPNNREARQTKRIGCSNSSAKLMIESKFEPVKLNSNETRMRRGLMTSRIMALLVGTVMVILLLASCATDAAQPPEPAPASKSAPAASVSSEETTDIMNSQEELIARGQELFQETAGGVGCAMCHGADASGDSGPEIRDMSIDDIQLALKNNEQMSFINLSPDEIEAVAAYLGYLATNE